jgi:hypothetical protein
MQIIVQANQFSLARLSVDAYTYIMNATETHLRKKVRLMRICTTSGRPVVDTTTVVLRQMPHDDQAVVGKKLRYGRKLWTVAAVEEAL